MKKRADVKKHYMCTNRNATIIINVSSFLYKSAAINKEAKKKKTHNFNFKNTRLFLQFKKLIAKKII